MGCYSFVNHVLAHHPGVALGLRDPGRRWRRCAPSSRRRPSTSSTAATSRATTGPASPMPSRAAAASGRRDRGRRRPRRAVRAGNSRRGQRRRGPGAPRRPAGTGRGGRRDRHARRAGRALRSARTRSAGRSSGRRAAAVCRRSSPARRAARAIAEVLSGRVDSSGHLPVSLPRSAGAQPYSYLHPMLGGLVGDHERRQHAGAAVRSRADLHDLRALRTWRSIRKSPTGGTFTAAVRIRNTGDRAGVGSGPAVRQGRLCERDASRRAAGRRTRASRSNPVTRPS